MDIVRVETAFVIGVNGDNIFPGDMTAKSVSQTDYLETDTTRGLHT